ncbi:hypothetical protein CEUSTIGMA_g2198.t1 [Chlamydomonas eustigma]|uniref:DNA-directed RNA polymerase III subunit RPC4 n=1 Tax=Chlamydomonas eustigma TaxID=1157962 RepID=A0A250WVA2_9CHLO|nr:hypothetical protein CEUSTIGMA_g2198.t1 [Chlamydomonas eustigma]|eukprot:GAX74751.1 hypothetical protein CEUSTIGMA_g2198.t1 [Chlamydomonas eustigma]
MDQPGPSTSGRGEDAKNGGKKVKFTPIVPTRRKKAGEGADIAVTAADAAAVNAEFQDLIAAAQSGAAWQRGRGRGGRGSQMGGRGSMGQPAAAQVTFGGSSLDRPSLAPAKPIRPGVSGVAASSNHNSSGHASQPSVKKEGGVDVVMEEFPAFESKVKVEEKRFVLQEALDYSQYYPTTLPLQPPGKLYNDIPDIKSGPLLDLAVIEDEVINTARDLSLGEEDEQEHMFLVQLPSVLPISAASKAAAVQAAASAPQAATGSSENSSKRAPAAGLTSEAASRSCSLKELPSGSVGKLLIYRSGRVKLRMGDVIMDVSPGLPCQHRMDAPKPNGIQAVVDNQK